jgi:signal transduction histidine kinase
MAGNPSRTRHGIRYLFAALALSAALACYLGATLAVGLESSIRTSERENASRLLAAYANQFGEKLLAGETAALDQLVFESVPSFPERDLPPLAEAFFELDSGGKILFPSEIGTGAFDPSALDFQSLVPSDNPDILAAADAVHSQKDYSAAIQRYDAAMRRGSLSRQARAVLAFRIAQCYCKMPGIDDTASQYFQQAVDLATDAGGAAMSYLRCCAVLEWGGLEERTGKTESAARRTMKLYRALFVERSLALPAPTAAYVEIEIASLVNRAAQGNSAVATEYAALAAERAKADEMAKSVEEIHDLITVALRTWAMTNSDPSTVFNFYARQYRRPVLLAMRRLPGENNPGRIIGMRLRIGAIGLRDLPADIAVRDKEGDVLPARSAGGEEWAGAALDVYVPGWRLASAEPPDLKARILRQRVLTIALSAICVGALAVCGVLLIRAERMRASLDRAKSEFISSVSHELCTPAANIRVISETLCTGGADEPTRRQEYLALLEVEAERLSALLDNLLEFSRGRHDAARYNIARGDIVAAVREAAAEFARRYDGEDLDLRTDLPTQAVEADFDAAAIRTALRNILDNAYKYSRPLRRISMALSARSGNAEIEISDNGIGIALDEIEKIFDRFWRSADKRVRPLAGYGIGLSLVRDIMAAHGGEVRAKSEPGKGSAFTLTLPLPRTNENS